jgi:predicted DNA-binding transcriptional regulator AlpA
MKRHYSEIIPPHASEILDCEEAAAFCRCSISQSNDHVKAERLPKPFYLDTRPRWFKEDLREALRRLTPTLSEVGKNFVDHQNGSEHNGSSREGMPSHDDELWEPQL